MPLESCNYGSVNGGQNSEPLRSYTDAEEAGKCPPCSLGSGGAYEECSPLVPDVLETRDSGQRRRAMSAPLVLLFCFLGAGGLDLAFSVLKGTKYGDFSTTSADPPLSYGSLEEPKHAMVNSCLLEVSRLPFLVVNILINVEFRGGIRFISYSVLLLYVLESEAASKTNQSEEDM